MSAELRLQLANLARETYSDVGVAVKFNKLRFGDDISIFAANMRKKHCILKSS